jgi:FdhD protein
VSSHNVVLSALSPELGWPSYQQTKIERWQGNQHASILDYVAEEVPVSLVYNGVPHVVMLVTPTNLEDFALGFSITEGIIDSPNDLKSIHSYNHNNGIEVRLEIPEDKFCNLSDKGRNLTGRTGCGLCGASTLKQAIRETKAVQGALNVNATELTSTLTEIKKHQQINQLTGAVHAAAWIIPGQGIQTVREDVGRHNALDKLIGVLVRTGKKPASGYVLLTSRGSYEVVQKAASVGICLLAAMSAPTGLAIRLADEAGMTLVGFVRDNQHVVYSHPERLNHSIYPTLINSSNS